MQQTTSIRLCPWVCVTGCPKSSRWQVARQIGVSSIFGEPCSLHPCSFRRVHVNIPDAVKMSQSRAAGLKTNHSLTSFWRDWSRFRNGVVTVFLIMVMKQKICFETHCVTRWVDTDGVAQTLVPTTGCKLKLKSESLIITYATYVLL